MTIAGFGFYSIGLYSLPALNGVLSLSTLFGLVEAKNIYMLVQFSVRILSPVAYHSVDFDFAFIGAVYLERI